MNGAAMLQKMLAVAGVLCALGGCTGLPTSAALPAAMLERPSQYVVVTVRNDSPRIGARAGSTLRGYDTVSGYGPSGNARSVVRQLVNTYGLREVSGWPIATLDVHCVVFEIPPHATVAQMAVRLRQDPRVESVQPLQWFATQAIAYNDPYQKLQRSLDSMNIAQAHRWSRGAGIHVAVVDTGVDIMHPDLRGRISEKQNLVDEDWAAFTADRHGTAVAGIIAANADNSMGIVGVAPQAMLHVYKACWQKESAIAAVCNSFTLAKALGAAIDAHVDIVNLSLAGPPDALLTRLVLQASKRGIVVVGAAPPDRRAGFPTDIDGVIAVASTRNGNDATVLVAPGTDVLTLVPQARYDFASGSSIAAANVSGVIALLLAREHKLQAVGLMQLLASTSRRTGSDAQPAINVNAAAALCSVVRDRSCSDHDSVATSSE